MQTLFAVRFVRELGGTAVGYGHLCALGAALSLAGILALGTVLDRLPLKSYPQRNCCNDPRATRRYELKFTR